MKRDIRTLGPGSSRRSVTITFGYPGGLRTLVAHNVRAALDAAERRWGHWLTVESISTPDTIYADVTGLTRARAQPGTNYGGNPGIRAKLEAAGYKAPPEEIGTVRRYRDELPRRHRDPNDPSPDPHWFPGRYPPRRRAGQ